MHCWHGPDGIEVEVIVLNVSPLYRVSKVANNTKYFIAYCATIDGLQQHVDLADLVEVIDFPADRQAAS